MEVITLTNVLIVVGFYLGLSFILNILGSIFEHSVVYIVQFKTSSLVKRMEVKRLNSVATGGIEKKPKTETHEAE